MSEDFKTVSRYIAPTVAPGVPGFKDPPFADKSWKFQLDIFEKKWLLIRISNQSFGYF
jgi:hypothetical protein